MSDRQLLLCLYGAVCCNALGVVSGLISGNYISAALFSIATLIGVYLVHEAWS